LLVEPVFVAVVVVAVVWDMTVAVEELAGKLAV
jgi:hypothetical protein